jgi:D-glycero-D-manno-heptose 1,7-bisphosphate phosphatase
MSAPHRLRPGLFLDRDGVLIENREAYVRSLDQAVPIPGAFEALGAFCQASPGHAVVLVTNQAGLGKGIIAQGVVDEIHAACRAWAKAAGARIDAIYVCPDATDGLSECRKPRPGMLLQAARDLELDLADSVMIGDALTDIQAGHNAGTRAILLRTGRGAAHEALVRAAGLAVPIYDDLAAALADLARAPYRAHSGGAGARPIQGT